MKTVITSNSYKLALLGAARPSQRPRAQHPTPCWRGDWSAGRAGTRPLVTRPPAGHGPCSHHPCTSVRDHAAVNMDRCEDTSSLLQGYGVGDKTARTMSSPTGGPRHTIDHILGLARREDGVDCRADTPGTGNESAGEYKHLLYIQCALDLPCVFRRGFIIRTVRNTPFHTRRTNPHSVKDTVNPQRIKSE